MQTEKLPSTQNNIVFNDIGSNLHVMKHQQKKNPELKILVLLNLSSTFKWSKLLSNISTRHGKYPNNSGTIEGALISVASHNCMKNWLELGHSSNMKWN